MPLDLPVAAMSRRTVTTLLEIGFTGLNITIPHKRRALEYCDRLGPSALTTGAVNTVRRADGSIVGENTDVLGLSRLFDVKKVHAKGVDSLVIGAGGAARAACRALLDAGSDVTVAARRDGKARALARSCGVKAESFSAVSAGEHRFGVIVNATPMGTRGTESEKARIPEGALRGRPVFIDLVYNPPVTGSMELARGRGCKAYGGLEMLLGQGGESFRMWTGRVPDLDAMRAAARRALI
jgi:shikimate dehydrogenase